MTNYMETESDLLRRIEIQNQLIDLASWLEKVPEQSQPYQFKLCKKRVMRLLNEQLTLW